MKGPLPVFVLVKANQKDKKSACVFVQNSFHFSTDPKAGLLYF